MRGKNVSLALSSLSLDPSNAPLWSTACNSTSGTLRPWLLVVFRPAVLVTSLRALCAGQIREISSVEDVGNLQKADAATLIDGTQNCAEQLSRFFPEVRAVRVPVQITAMRPGRTRLREASVLNSEARSMRFFCRLCRSNLAIALRWPAKIDPQLLKLASSPCSITKGERPWRFASLTDLAIG